MTTYLKKINGTSINIRNSSQIDGLN